MRSRTRRLIAAASLALLAVPASSSAQFVFAGAGGAAGSGAVAYIVDGAREGGFFAFSGAAGEVSTEIQGAGQIIEGCAGLYDGNENQLDTGCGEFTVVDVAPDLSAATISGTIDSALIDFDDDTVVSSTLTISGTLTGTGDPIPFADAFEIAEIGLFGEIPFAFIGAGGFAELDRIAGGTTSISSGALGTLSGPVADAVLFEGAGLGAVVFAEG